MTLSERLRGHCYATIDACIQLFCQSQDPKTAVQILKNLANGHRRLADDIEKEGCEQEPGLSIRAQDADDDYLP